jgi:hypothetical protein
MQKKGHALFLGGTIGETLGWRLHPLIHTLLNFNLVQNAVDGQVKAFQKITPIG